MSTQSDTIVKILKAQLPGVANTVLMFALAEAATDLNRDGLGLPRPVDYKSDPDTWLTAPDDWIEHHNALVSGTLARLMAQPSKPYTDLATAAVHSTLFQNAILRARTNAQKAVTDPLSRLMATVRVAVPAARDDTIRHSLFGAVDELARDVLQVTPPNHADEPFMWLTNADYGNNHQLLIHGVLARMYAEVNQPWANTELAKFHIGEWTGGLRKVRANQASANQSSASARVLAELRVAAPGARDSALQQAIFGVVYTLTTDALQITPPSQTSPYNTWMPESVWAEYFDTIRDGAMAAVLGQPGQAWSDPDRAKGYADAWAFGLRKVRELKAAQASPTGFDRLMANVRFAVPGVRDSAIHQELFNTVDEFRRNVLQLSAPAHTAAPNAWMTSAEYDQYFRLLTAGVLYRLFMQSNKPWTDLKAAALQQQVYADEVGVVRGDAGDDAAVNPTDRLLTNIRADLPSVKDAALFQQLFNVIDEACRHGHVWVEVVQVQIKPGQKLFTINVPGADIARVTDVSHPSIDGDVQYSNGRVYVRGEITEADALRPVEVVAALAPASTVDMTKPESWVPSDLWGTLHQMLLHGTLSRLMLTPSKSYTNTELGKFHGLRHRRFLLQATRDVRSSGIAPTRPTWRFPRFAR